MFESCENCKFFRPDPVNMKNGKCHHKSPTGYPLPQPNGSISYVASHPPVERNSWCGDYIEAAIEH